MRWIASALVAALAATITGHSAQAREPVATPKAVWASADAADAFACGTVQCLVGEMRKRGASPQAIALAQKLSLAGDKPWPTWPVSFVKQGPVDLVLYNCASCRMGGFAMVNGSPEVVEEASAVPDLEKCVARAIAPKHASAMLLNGEALLGVRRTPDGGQRFLFGNPVGDCNACAPYAAVGFSFSFDPSGRLLAHRIDGLVPLSAMRKGRLPPAN